MLWLRSYRRQTVGKTAQIHRLATLATFKGGPWEQLFLFGVTEGFAFVLRVVTDNDTGAAIVSKKRQKDVSRCSRHTCGIWKAS